MPDDKGGGRLRSGLTTGITASRGGVRYGLDVVFHFALFSLV